MVKPVLPGHHRILIGAEIGQGGADEMRERPARLCGRDRQSEFFQSPEMRTEALRNEREDIARQGIGREVHRLGIVEPVLRRLAILLVEIPLPTLGRAAGRHQQAGLAPHLAVEIFHHEIIACLRPGLKFEDAADEAIVSHHLDRKAEALRPAIDHRSRRAIRRIRRYGSRARCAASPRARPRR
jgi:hypothetical protein